MAYGETLLLGWEDVFRLLASEDYRDSGFLLNLPPTTTLEINLTARGSISDPHFDLALDWCNVNGNSPGTAVTRTGAVVYFGEQESLLSESAWRLAAAVREFARRPTTERTQNAQERAWGHIRQLVTLADANLDLYLERTVILTVEQLELALRHVEVQDSTIVEITPRVSGLPDEIWLAAFDSYIQVTDHYDLITAKGERIRVLLEPDVRAVLSEIRRMPGRRVAGSRAEAFLRNPYALLGEIMARVTPPEYFEAARDTAGIYFYSFRDEICREPDGHVYAVRLILEPFDENAPALPPVELTDKVILHCFVAALETGIESGLPCFHWRRQTLELRGDTEERLYRLRTVLHEPWVGEPLVKYAAIHDLARYSPRVKGIGIHQPQYTPYIAQKDGQGSWTPENLEPVVQYQPPDGQPVLVKVNDDARVALRQWLDDMPPADGRFTPPSWPAPITALEAQQVLSTLDHAFSVVKTGQLEKSEPKSPTQPLTLSIGENVEAIDYIEERTRLLALDELRPPNLTGWLLPDISLKNHQHRGLAWLQHLWCCANYGVRGALLADDMGLGKTLQLLAFIAGYLEQMAEQADPVLIVAPVSLLENWQIEISKFFDTRLSNRVLLLYGRELGQLKIREHEVEV